MKTENDDTRKNEPTPIMALAGLEERLNAALDRTAAMKMDGQLKVFRGAVEELLGYLEKMKAGEPQKFGLKLAKNAEFVLREFEREYPAEGERGPVERFRW